MKTKLILAAVGITIIAAACCNCGQKTQLFNGKDLTGWVCINKDNIPAEQIFGVTDGNIRIIGNPFGYMRTAQKYSDYTLHVEWRWVGEATNSGIFQRVQDQDKVWPDAIECQLCAGRAGDFVMLGGSKIEEVECNEEFPVKDRNGNFEKPTGEWNQAKIVCKGNKITVYINGQLQNECTAQNSEGYIALQSEGGPIEFRNIYLTEM